MHQLVDTGVAHQQGGLMKPTGTALILQPPAAWGAGASEYALLSYKHLALGQLEAHRALQAFDRRHARAFPRDGTLRPELWGR